MQFNSNCDLIHELIHLFTFNLTADMINSVIQLGPRVLHDNLLLIFIYCAAGDWCYNIPSVSVKMKLMKLHIFEPTENNKPIPNFDCGNTLLTKASSYKPITNGTVLMLLFNS